jgi:hypothetical protein
MAVKGVTSRDIAQSHRVVQRQTDLASAYVLCPLTIIILYFRRVLPKTSRVTVELRSYNEDKRTGYKTETEGILVDVSDRIGGFIY